MQAAAIEAATDAISFVALHAQAEGQVAGGDGIAEGIGALGPVGEAANFVTDAGVHREIITFEFASSGAIAREIPRCVCLPQAGSQ